LWGKVVLPESKLRQLLKTLAGDKIPAASLRSDDLPDRPGVYVWFQRDVQVFIGTTGNLRKRVFAEHLAQPGQAMGSALRRLAASTLGFATNAQLRSGKYRLSESERIAVEAWIQQGEVAWLQTETDAEAVSLASSLQLKTNK
jgi:hypothetical protein